MSQQIEQLKFIISENKLEIEKMRLKFDENEWNNQKIQILKQADIHMHTFKCMHIVAAIIELMAFTDSSREFIVLLACITDEMLESFDKQINDGDFIIK